MEETGDRLENIENLRQTFLTLRRALLNGEANIWQIGKEYKRFLFECDEKGIPIKIRNPNAFFLGALVDRQIPSEKAWAFPYELKRRLGSIDPYFLAELPLEKIEEAIARKPALHRHPKQISRCIKRAALLLVEKYNGNAASIWETANSYEELYKRLTEFPCIGDKIANMIIRILHDYFGYDFGRIDLPVDRHDRRVVARLTGGALTPKELAKLLFPENPAIIDEVLFYIGKNYCKPRKPRCDECPLKEVCTYSRSGKGY